MKPDIVPYADHVHPRTKVSTKMDILSSANHVHPRTKVSTKMDILSSANHVHPRTKVIHFGCRLNQFETDGIKANLQENSHSLTEDQREANYIVINTCTVTNKADYKNRAAIRRAHKLNPDAKIIVTGCYATTDAEEIRQMPGVYRVVSNDQKHNIANILKNGSITATEEIPNDRFHYSANHHFKSRATLKIQDGCNKSCSYCKIPQARGRGVSRDFDETLNAARELVDSGYGELVLTGINIGWYEANGRTFYKLLETILGLSGNFHVRISSIEPGDVTEQFAAFYTHEKMAKFLHIPVQSGSKFVLRTMRRGYTPQTFMRRIEHVRKICPDIHIGTDVIVGFPSEGEAEFIETLDFCRNADFANIHIFPFSKRRNTPIVDWLERREKMAKDKNAYQEINGNVIRERIGRLIELKNKMAIAYAQRVAGKEFWAIAEHVKNGAVEYLTENYLRGRLDNASFKRGERFRITLPA
ncbi:MAG: tRNA-2-methylthio-N(6)-dimethylallyladenosine synthase [Turneriella sp.]|nr:tRNA-2-methylthio-N(6)-dimethylallyladenosine synthase [Turneriella sp.]